MRAAAGLAKAMRLAESTPMMPSATEF